MALFAFSRRAATRITSRSGRRQPRCLPGSCLSVLFSEYTETMHYELWETLSRNMLADFETEADALAEIRALLQINPPEMVDELVLVWRDGSRGGTLAEGTALAAWARAATSGRGISSA